jgi:hypothetical protein
MPLLIPKSFDFGYGHAADAELRQGILHFFELKWLDDSDNEFHSIPGCGLSERGRCPGRQCIAEMQPAERQP